MSIPYLRHACLAVILFVLLGGPVIALDHAAVTAASIRESPQHTIYVLADSPNIVSGHH